MTEIIVCEKFLICRRQRDCGSTLVKYFGFVSICKYLLTVGLREHAFNVTQSWPGILKFSRGIYDHDDVSFTIAWPARSKN